MAISRRALRAAGLLGATGLTAVGLTFAAGASTATAATPTFATAAVACTAPLYSEYEAWNQNCTYAQIWNKVSSVGTVYGSRVGPQAYTVETLCYANVTSYGVNKGTKTGAS